MAGSLFGGDLEPGEREATYGGAVGLGASHEFSLEAEVAVIPALRQFGHIELLLGTAACCITRSLPADSHPTGCSGVTRRNSSGPVECWH